MANLPPNSNFTGGSVTQGSFKTALNALLDFVRESVGSTGGAENWRTALGLGALATENEVSSGLLGGGAVTTAKIGDGQVTAVKLAAGAVGSAALADSAVTTAKIGDGQVTAAKLASGAVPPGVPAGTVVAYAGSAAPTGWLVCNGAAVSRTTYAALFAAIGTAFGPGDGSTTFNLPDLRGEFVRGWDAGRGVDPSRVFGSAQGSQNLAHTHTASTDTAGAHTHTTPQGLEGTGASLQFASTGSSGVSTVSGSAGAHSHTVTVGSSGGTEARPRNVALLYVIRT
jgi:microcystin-dependent protein